jgi:hypothetical protein
MNQNWSPWLRYMLDHWGYYYTPEMLERVEGMEIRARARELRAVHRGVVEANRVRKLTGLPRLPPAYSPPGPLFRAQWPNPMPGVVYHGAPGYHRQASSWASPFGGQWARAKPWWAMNPPDERLRHLRAVAATGNVEAGAELLKERARAGEITMAHIELAAQLGRADALLLKPQAHETKWRDPTARVFYTAQAIRFVGGNVAPLVAADWAERSLIALSPLVSAQAQRLIDGVRRRALGDSNHELPEGALWYVTNSDLNPTVAGRLALSAVRHVVEMEVGPNTYMAGAVAISASRAISARRNIPLGEEFEWQMLRLAAYVLGEVPVQSRNPGQDFLFGQEAQEPIRRPATPHTRRPVRKLAPTTPFEVQASEHQADMFVYPDEHPDPPAGHRVLTRLYRDYRGWLNFWRGLPDERLKAEWARWEQVPPNEPVGKAMKAGLHRALLERGLLGGGGLPQIMFHTRNPPEDEEREAMLAQWRQQAAMKGGQLPMFPGAEARVWSALDVQCEACGAAVGELCFLQRAAGKDYMRRPHDLRARAAGRLTSDHRLASRFGSDLQGGLPPKSNPDDRMQRLRRLASLGDPSAAAELHGVQAREGGKAWKIEEVRRLLAFANRSDSESTKSSAVAGAYLIAASELVWGMDGEEGGEYGTRRVIVPLWKSRAARGWAPGALAVIFTEYAKWNISNADMGTLDLLERVSDRADEILGDFMKTYVEYVNAGVLGIYET